MTPAAPAGIGVSPWLKRYVASVDACALIALALATARGWPEDPWTLSLVAALGETAPNNGLS